MNLYEKFGENRRIIIEQIDGDMQLRGQAGEEAVIRGSNTDIEVPDDPQAPVRIRCAGDCAMKLPAKLPIHIQQVNGDAKITGLAARLDITSIHGDSSLRRVEGQLVIDNLLGDTEIKGIDGNVALTSVSGDAAISRVDGHVTVAHVSGDLLLRNISGGCGIEYVSGDLSVGITFSPENDYNFAANDSIVFDILPATNATFLIPADVEVMLKLKATEVTEQHTDDDTDMQVIVFGDGAATVQIHEANTVAFRVAADPANEVNFDFDFGSQFKEMESELNKRFATLGKMIEEQAKAFASASARAVEDLDIESTMERVRQRAARGAERAQQRAHRAAERARRHAERNAERNAERARRFEQRQPPQQPAEPVREEERLLILQMVQDGKISIEEAEQLLTTLEDS